MISKETWKRFVELPTVDQQEVLMELLRALRFAHAVTQESIKAGGLDPIRVENYFDGVFNILKLLGFDAYLIDRALELCVEGEAEGDV